MPDTVNVDPLTAVTLPDAMASEASCLRKLLAPEPPLGKLGRVPPPKPDPPLPPPPELEAARGTRRTAPLVARAPSPVQAPPDGSACSR